MHCKPNRYLLHFTKSLFKITLEKQYVSSSVAANCCYCWTPFYKHYICTVFLRCVFDSVSEDHWTDWSRARTLSICTAFHPCVYVGGVVCFRPGRNPFHNIYTCTVFLRYAHGGGSVDYPTGWNLSHKYHICTVLCPCGVACAYGHFHSDWRSSRKHRTQIVSRFRSNHSPDDENAPHVRQDIWWLSL